MTGVLPDLTWMDDAACKGMTGLMFSDRTTHAVELCAECPVVHPCRTRALIDREEWGVWGGLRPEERARAAGRVGRLRRCAVCDSWFEPARSGRYCGALCRQEAHRQQVRESWQRTKAG